MVVNLAEYNIEIKNLRHKIILLADPAFLHLTAASVSGRTVEVGFLLNFYCRNAERKGLLKAIWML